MDEEQQYRTEIGLPYAYAVVDAAFHMFAEDDLSLTPGQGISYSVQREQLSAGSCRYIVITTGRVSGRYGSIVIRAVRSDATQLHITTGEMFLRATPREIAGSHIILSQILTHFIGWIQHDQSRTATSIEVYAKDHPQRPLSETTLSDSIPKSVSRKPGAPINPNNDWARQEIARGTDRDVVFLGYMERLNFDPNNALQRSQARERFKKAIAGIHPQKQKRKSSGGN